MAYSIKEEELADHESLDQHDEGCSKDGEQTDDVAHANDVEDDITWPGQGALEEGHV